MKIIDYVINDNGELVPIVADVEITEIKKPDTENHNNVKEVIINGVRGFLKESSESMPTFDKFDYLLAKLGKLLGLSMADEYLVKDGDKTYLFSKSVVKENEKLIMFSQINKEIIKRWNIPNEMIDRILNNEDINELFIEYNISDDIKMNFIQLLKEINELKEFRNNQELYDPTPGKEKYKVNDDNIEYIINIFINRIKVFHLPNEDEIIKDYIKMCFFDALIGNKDRNVNNYGIIKKEDGTYSFAPLFDSSTLAIRMHNNEEISSELWQLNEYLMDRKKTLQYIIKTYPNYIKDMLDNDIEKIREIISLISKEVLDEEELEWFNSVIIDKLNNKTFDYIKESDSILS